MNNDKHPDLKIYPEAKVIPEIKPFKDRVSGDIGDFSFITCRELKMGEGVHIADHVSIIGKGEVIIKNHATIAPGVRIWTSEPDVAATKATNKYQDGHQPKVGRVIIGSDTFIGSNSCVKEGTEIGDGAVVGALSFVRQDLTEGCVYAGNPAEKIKEQESY